MKRRIYMYVFFVLIALVFAFVFQVFFESPVFNKLTKKAFINHYDKNEYKIKKLVLYFKNIAPKDAYVEVEIGDVDELESFHIIKDGKERGGRDLDINSALGDSILSILNWDRQTLDSLRYRLEEVECISVDNASPARVGYHRTPSNSRYNYVVFDISLLENKDLLKKYNDNCRYIFYRDNVVLEHQSSLLAPKCFPERFLD